MIKLFLLLGLIFQFNTVIAEDETDFDDIDEDEIYYQATDNATKLNLSEKDLNTLEIGYISDAEYVVGGILGTYPLGLGIGHAIQGRYSDKGWIFTVGQLGSMAVLIAGISDCLNDDSFWSADDCSGSGDTLIGLGLAGYVGFRIWEIIDLWAVPPGHNRRYKGLYRRVNKGTVKEKVSYLFYPTINSRKERYGLNVGISF